MAEEKHIRIGEVAHLVGAHPDRIRHYVKHGLIHPQVDPITSYRLFTQQQVEQLQIILELRRYQVSLPQIKKLLDTQNSDELLEMLENHALNLEKELQRQRTLVQELRQKIDRTREQTSAVSSLTCLRFLFIGHEVNP